MDKAKYLPTVHNSPTFPGGRVEVHTLTNSTRMDIISEEVPGRPVRRETRHFEDVREARLVGSLCAVCLCIDYRDFTGEGRA